MRIIWCLKEKEVLLWWITYESSSLFQGTEQSIYMMNDKVFSSISFYFSWKNTERKKNQYIE